MTIYCNEKPYEIPTDWSGVTFEMFLKLVDCKTESERLAVFIGMDAETIRTAKIKGFDSVMTALAFTNGEAPLVAVPKKILGYDVPKNLELEQVGRYEDLKLILASFPQEGKLNIDSIRKYVDLCGVILQPDYMDSNDEQKEAFAKRFLNAPCLEVLAIGNFLLWKLIALRMGIKTHSLTSNTPMKKFRLALIVWLKRLVFTVRFYFWKRKAGLTGIPY